MNCLLHIFDIDIFSSCVFVMVCWLMFVVVYFIGGADVFGGSPIGMPLIIHICGR